MAARNARLRNGADEKPDQPHDQINHAARFPRIAQRTLAGADTTIEELYAWEFRGPQMRDFTGRKRGGARNAGAIDLAP